MQARLRPIQGFATAALGSAIVVQLSLPDLWGAFFQELGRGMAAMSFGGVWASFGVLIAEEILLYAGDPWLTLLRLTLLTAPHLILGLLWQQYGIPGGGLAVAEHLAWNYWLHTSLWPIPVGGMILIYFLLIRNRRYE